jgi:hypothetical protein
MKGEIAIFFRVCVNLLICVDFAHLAVYLLYDLTDSSIDLFVCEEFLG